MDSILDKMQVNQSVDNLLEVGCGYGTFTINTAKRISGKLTAFDIEREMIDYTKNKAIQEGLTDIGLFNHIGEQLRNYVTAGGEILACGTCIKSRQLENSMEVCPISTMVDCVNVVIWADKTVTF